MNILGISCFYHDSAACLVSDGRVTAAAQEERFNRRKYSQEFPVLAVNYCLQSAGITINDVDCVAFYEKPFLKFYRVLAQHLKNYPFSIPNFLRYMPEWLDDRLVLPLKLENDLGYKGKVLFIPHHLAHAASAFLASGFADAAILTVDGVGEWDCATIGRGTGIDMQVLARMEYPDSLGLLYSIVTTYLGFRVFEGEGKVMAMAGLGSPVYADTFRKIMSARADGSFFLDRRYFNFSRGARMFNSRFVSLFGKERPAGCDFCRRHFDIAASLQAVTEEILIAMASHAHALTGSENLCLAGGVFLNCVANDKIRKNTPYKRMFIQPAAGDSGAALGAALYVHNVVQGNPRTYVMTGAALGPEYSSTQIRREIVNSGLPFEELSDEDLIRFAARKIAENKVIAWFQGRMEFGPRALGNRSILANPRDPRMKEVLNTTIKRREFFQPYAPLVREDEAGRFFDLDCPSPFMLLAPLVRDTARALIPAVVHDDSTARVQTVTRESDPRLYALLCEFERISGVGVLINTSFNLSREPIVCSPRDAIDSFVRSAIDHLVLGNFAVSRKEAA